MADKVNIEREALHAELDKFLDDIAKDPLNVTDGEEHVFKLVGGVTAHASDGEDLTQFTVTTSRTKLV